MKTVSIYRSEMYPVYRESPLHSTITVQVPESLWADYIAALNRFEDLLCDIDDIVEKE